MKKFISICFVLCVAVCAIAQQPPAEKILATFDWKDLMAQHSSPHFEIVSMDGMSVLRIENTNDTPLQVSLLTITSTPLIKGTRQISVEIKFENVFGRNSMGGFYGTLQNGSGELLSRPGNIEDQMQSFGDGGLGLSC